MLKLSLSCHGKEVYGNLHVNYLSHEKKPPCPLVDPEQFDFVFLW